MAQLSGGRLGEFGSDGVVRLDTDAAGHGWFVDATPGDNSEFLPTSDSNIFIAKPGSAAEGKMDMLSVLLHEYSHALGLDHSADPQDAMAPVLQPGVRHLLSPQDLALLHGLYLPDTETAESGQQPKRPPVPVPGGPGMPFLPSLAAFLWKRREQIAKGETVEALPAVQNNFTTAANATLENGNFASGQWWSTTGAATFASMGATLTESEIAQTSLRQIFMLRPGGRYLRYTVDGLTLHQASGPGDAFEVALLNANTNEALLSIDGQTRSDALQNIQAGGLERTAAQVRRFAGSDGSMTYVLDLQGIAAGTPVALSFDLIGFGVADSSVTIRNVALGQPEAVADTGETLEDTPVRLEITANDLTIDPALFKPEVVAGPAHGTVTRSSDDSFSYTPDLNYFGTDSFTYRLSDGTVHSNVVTVSLTITPVNDAPVASDAALTIAEDAGLTFDLRNYGLDVDSLTLTPVITTGPAHGSLVLNEDGTYTYTPDANYHGSDALRFKLNDGELDSNEATLALTVTPVNDAPAATDAALDTSEDTPLNVDLRTYASDVDGDTLDASIVAAPLHGAVTRNDDGSFTYTPNANYFGEDRFTYWVNDGQGEPNSTSNLATVTLTIAPVNDAPVASDAALTTAEDTSLVVDLRAYGFDVDSTTLTPVIVEGPAHGTLTANEDGSYSYIPNLDYFGSDAIRFKLNDGELDSNIATVSLTVTPVNDAPVASHAFVAGVEDTPVVIDLRGYGADVDSTVLTPAIVAGPEHGTLTRNEDGTYTYTPLLDYNGPDRFSYRLDDRRREDQ